MARVGPFSTTSSLEGDWFITNDNLSYSSERQLVGYDTVDLSCDGGFVDNGTAFGEKNGLCMEASYSYITTKGTCQDSSCTVDILQGSVTGYKDVSTVGERALMSAVAWRPVCTAIEADQSSFQSHMSCVLTVSRGVMMPKLTAVEVFQWRPRVRRGRHGRGRECGHDTTPFIPLGVCSVQYSAQ